MVQICSRCKVQKSNENFLNAKGKTLLTCINCRTRAPAIKQAVQQSESDSESECDQMTTRMSSDSDPSYDNDDDGEPFHVVCSFCNTEYNDFDSAEKHVNSKKHKQNMKQQ